MSTRLTILLKSIVAVGLLGFLLWRMDLTELVEVFSTAKWLFVFSAALIHFGIVGISTSRWRIILANFSIKIGFISAAQLLLIGYFFNLFLPSSFGGDFVRSFYLAKQVNRGMSTSLMTTGLDRAAGMTGLLLIGLLAVNIHPAEIEGVSLRLIFIAISSAFGFGLIIVFNSKVHSYFVRILQRFRLKGIEEKLEQVFQGINCLWRNKPAMVVAVLYSLCIQGAVIICMWIAARALDISAPFSVFLVFIPIINLAVTVPLTINGIGLRESAYTLLFSQLGVPMEKAFALSLLNFLVVASTSVIGGVVYSFYKRDESFELREK